MSFFTLIKAHSTLCLDLYADWKGSSRLLDSICLFSLLQTAFSMSFPTNGKFETGL